MVHRSECRIGEFLERNYNVNPTRALLANTTANLCDQKNRKAIRQLNLEGANDEAARDVDIVFKIMPKILLLETIKAQRDNMSRKNPSASLLIQ